MKDQRNLKKHLHIYQHLINIAKLLWENLIKSGMEVILKYRNVQLDDNSLYQKEDLTNLIAFTNKELSIKFKREHKYNLTKHQT